MSLVDILFSRGKPSEGLGGFDKREEEDLGLHVANCARRYDDLRFSIDRVSVLLWLVILILMASNVIDVPGLVERWLFG